MPASPPPASPTRGACAAPAASRATTFSTSRELLPRIRSSSACGSSTSPSRLSACAREHRVSSCRASRSRTRGKSRRHAHRLVPARSRCRRILQLLDQERKECRAAVIEVGLLALADDELADEFHRAFVLAAAKVAQSGDDVHGASSGFRVAHAHIVRPDFDLLIRHTCCADSGTAKPESETHVKAATYSSEAAHIAVVHAASRGRESALRKRVKFLVKTVNAR